MKQASTLRIIYMLLILAVAGGCKKIVNVNLNSTAARYVVEANVTDQSGPYLVSITKSVNFDQDNVYPAVSGAVVVITDNTSGLADTLKEPAPGNYYTSKLTGTPGHSYQLYINTAGNIFTASCTMPMPVTLDSLYVQNSIFGGDYFDLVPMYTDPVIPGNSYHFSEVKNDTLTDNVQIRNDALVNGQVIKRPIDGGLQSGDKIMLSLECIDSAMYQYYYSLQQTKNQNSATPANPLSNIKGGALGYFSAHTLSSKSIIVP